MHRRSGGPFSQVVKECGDGGLLLVAADDQLELIGTHQGIGIDHRLFPAKGGYGDESGVLVVGLQNIVEIVGGGPTAYNLYNILEAYYQDAAFVSVAPFGGEEPVIYSNTLVGTNQLQLIVCGHEEQTTITALFDNLGKGASGAAVQNMNLMLGFDEAAGLL